MNPIHCVEAPPALRTPLSVSPSPRAREDREGGRRARARRGGRPMSPPRRGRRAFLHTCAAGLLAATLPGRAFGRAAPVRIGVDAEFMDPNSTADDAVLFGAQAAVDDLNARGGVLGGRPLQLVTSDNRSVPARGVANLERLGAERDVVGVLCGKFSPVVIEQLPTLHALRLPLLDPWAAADAIIDNGQRPNYAFRMGLSDTLAIDALLGEIERRKLRRIGLLAPQTAWGRSCQYAAERYIASRARQRLAIVGIEWQRWGAHDSIPDSYRTLLELGADALLLIANEPEGAALVKGLAGMPAQDLRPIFSHWEISGGRFPELCGAALQHVELELVQSFSFTHARGEDGARLAQRAMRHFGAETPLAVPSQTGIGPAYDLVRLLAVAIERAGGTHRPAIHEALEHLPTHEGVVRSHAPAFTPTRYEALGAGDVLLCRFDAAGQLRPR